MFSWLSKLCIKSDMQGLLSQLKSLVEEMDDLVNLYSPNIVLRSPFYFALVQIKGAKERGYSPQLYLTYPVSHARLHLQRGISLEGTMGQKIRDPSLTRPMEDPVQGQLPSVKFWLL